MRDDLRYNLIRVKKPVANILYNATVNIYLLPSKVDLYNKFVDPYLISIFKDGNFNKIVSQYEYNCCNNRIGKKASYYTYNIKGYIIRNTKTLEIISQKRGNINSFLKEFSRYYNKYIKRQQVVNIFLNPQDGMLHLVVRC